MFALGLCQSFKFILDSSDIVYNNFVTFAKESFMEKIKILKNEIFTIGVEERSFSVNISKRDPSPLLKDQYLL